MGLRRECYANCNGANPAHRQSPLLRKQPTQSKGSIGERVASTGGLRRCARRSVAVGLATTGPVRFITKPILRLSTTRRFPKSPPGWPQSKTCPAICRASIFGASPSDQKLVFEVSKLTSCATALANTGHRSNRCTFFVPKSSMHWPPPNSSLPARPMVTVTVHSELGHSIGIPKL
jgi:hypothetical protein